MSDETHEYREHFSDDRTPHTISAPWGFIDARGKQHWYWSGPPVQRSGGRNQ